ncbi:MAG TPA: PAS domain S-box protein [Caulobacteraceae bacterium]|jgi:PAS domain S-box-containing protein
MSAQPRGLGASLLAAALAAAALVNIADILGHETSPPVHAAMDGLGLAALLIAGVVAWRWRGEVRTAQEQLRRSEARHRSIVEGAGEAIIVIDDQATIVAFNQAAERMFGYAAAEMIGTSLERLMTDGVRRAHAAYLLEHGHTALVQARGAERTLQKGVRKQGGVFPFELSMTEWFDGDRRMFTGVMRDVTERERAAAELRESQARYAGVYDNSSELLFTYAVDGEGGFVLESMNRAAEDYTGQSRSALAGLTPDQLTGPNAARTLKRALIRCLDTRASAPLDLPLGVGGRRRMLHLMLSPLRDGAGEITRVLVSGRVGAEVEPQPAA